MATSMAAPIVEEAVAVPSHDIFVPREKFIAGERDGLRISIITDSFRSACLGLSGAKIETNIPAGTVDVTGARRCLNGPFAWCAEGEVSLAHLYDLLLAQGDGRKGPLPLNRKIISRITNVPGWQICIKWNGEGWELDAERDPSADQVMLAFRSR